MSGKTAVLALKITGNASGGIDALDKVEGRSSRFAGVMGKVGLLAGGALAGAAVGFTKLYEAADESRKIGNLTEQVIKSTGGAAQVTSKQVGDLAGAIAKKTGVDDEAIQSGENLLLTFTNVKNGVGAGNDIFNQATKIMTDMSVALGTDASGSAIQLGKALNDPVKGVTALQKVGVSFTADQKEQIKTLVKTGDTMGAQKVILNELGKEFGGAAEAASTPLDRLKQRAGDFAEKIGGFLLPVVDQASAFLGDKLLPVISDLAEKIGPVLGPIIQRAGQFISTTLVPAVTALWQEFGPKLLPIIKTVGGFITGFLVPAFKVVGDYVATYLVPFFKAVFGPAIDGLSAAFRTVSNAVMSHKGQIMALYESLKPFLAFIRDKVAPFLGGALKIGFEIAGKAIGGVVTVVAWLIDKLKWILDKGAAVGRFIGGLFGAPASPALRGAAGGTALMGAPGGPLMGAPMFSPSGGTSPSAGRGLTPVGNTYNITINGALDPVAVGRQVDRVLQKYGAATGRQVALSMGSR